jgi:hypothetical protein
MLTIKLLLMPCQGKLRLDAFLAGHMPDASRAKVQSSIKGGLVLVNGKVASKVSMVVKPGDMVACELLPPPPMEVRPAADAAQHVHAAGCMLLAARLPGISSCCLHRYKLHDAWNMLAQLAQPIIPLALLLPGCTLMHSTTTCSAEHRPRRQDSISLTL